MLVAEIINVKFNVMLPVILTGIGTATAWGLADIFIAQSTKSVRPIFAAALVNSLGALLFTFYFLLFARETVNLDTTGIWFSIAAGSFIAVAAIFFFIGLHQGPVGIVSAISSTYPAVTLVIAISIFGVSVSIQQMLGIGFVVIGVTIASGLLTKTKRSGSEESNLGPLIAILAAVSWGVGYGLLAEGVKLLGWQMATLIQVWSLTACYLLLGLFTSKQSKLIKTSFQAALTNPYLLGAAFLQQIGATLLNVGLSIDNTGGSIVVALSACYPILTSLLAFIYFQERTSPIALAGALLSIVGIVTISVS
jgi:drug/metabolite transporter (DMT)-like permease